MSKPRWNSGLAAAVSNGAPGCSCISNDRADVVEELINSCEGIDCLLKAVAELLPGFGIETATSVLEFRAAITRAKNWDRPEKCPACQGDGFITLPGEQPVCRKCRGLGEVKGK
jgi:hypothetical protein